MQPGPQRERAGHDRSRPHSGRARTNLGAQQRERLLTAPAVPETPIVVRVVRMSHMRWERFERSSILAAVLADSPGFVKAHALLVLDYVHHHRQID